MEAFDLYLVLINLAGFFCCLPVGHAPKEKLLMLFSFLGGSLGAFLGLWLFDRKLTRENALSRVFILCALLSQPAVILMIHGFHRDPLNFNFGEFFGENQFLTAYLLLINVLTFAVYAADKSQARHHQMRIRISVLLCLAFAGGSIGAWLAMYLLHHKTRQAAFTVGIPMILCQQAVLIFFAMNAQFTKSF